MPAKSRLFCPQSHVPEFVTDAIANASDGSFTAADLSPNFFHAMPL
jgi:hypothetical protein